jgi:tol-pal system protein YbgF
MMSRLLLRSFSGLALLACAVPAMAQPSLDQRMDRAERQLNTLAEMAQELRAAREEIQRLNGAMEELRHEQKQLEQRQTTLYSDLEQRLQTATGAPTAAAASGPAAKETPASPAAEDKEWPAYKAAYDLLRDGKYAEAEQGLVKFLRDFPAGQYAGHAQYWLGESFYVRGKYDEALNAFRALQSSYPSSPKAEAGQLKEAFSLLELRQADAAKTLLERLGMSRDADLAKRARERLKSLQ